MASPTGINQYTKGGGFKQVKKAWGRLATAKSPRALELAKQNFARAGSTQQKAFRSNPSILKNLAKRRK